MKKIIFILSLFSSVSYADYKKNIQKDFFTSCACFVQLDSFLGTTLVGFGSILEREKEFVIIKHFDIVNFTENTRIDLENTRIQCESFREELVERKYCLN